MTVPFALPVWDRTNVVSWLGVVAVTLYFAFLSHAVRAWPYEEWMVVVLIPILLAIGVAIIVGVTRRDNDPMTVLIIFALVLKLTAAFVRHFVAFSLYGSGDSAVYDEVGADIANSFHRGDLSLVDLLSLRQGTAFLDDLTGLVYAVTGPSRIGGFVVFSWLGFWGLFLFHRAALIGLPEGNQRRYAMLVFFLPSLVFWPSSIGKEAVMMLALGFGAYGAARVLERQPSGWLALAAGTALAYMVRPHVAVLVLAALTVAMLFRPRRDKRAVFGPVGRIVAVVVLVAAMAFVLAQALDRLLPRGSEATGVDAVGEVLDRAETGTDEGGSQIDRPSPNSPFEYPQAVFSVLFRPTILEAGSAGNAFAAAETTLILFLAVAARQRLRNVVSIAFRRPYVLFCIVYTGIFAFAWSSFSNLGALARQRVQVWPFVVLLLVIPASGARRQDTAAARRTPVTPGGRERA